MALSNFFHLRSERFQITIKLPNVSIFSTQNLPVTLRPYLSNYLLIFNSGWILRWCKCEQQKKKIQIFFLHRFFYQNSRKKKFKFIFSNVFPKTAEIFFLNIFSNVFPKTAEKINLNLFSPTFFQKQQKKKIKFIFSNVFPKTAEKKI